MSSNDEPSLMEHTNRSKDPWNDRVAIITKRTNATVYRVNWRAFDLFGSAKSKAEELAQLLLTEIEGLSEDVTIIGHSLGGLVALRIAEQVETDNVKGVVALSPALEESKLDWDLFEANTFKTEIVFARDDWALWGFGLFRTKAVGSGPNKKIPTIEGIRWINADDLVAGTWNHDYLKNFEQIMSRTELWKMIHPNQRALTEDRDHPFNLRRFVFASQDGWEHIITLKKPKKGKVSKIEGRFQNSNKTHKRYGAHKCIAKFISQGSVWKINVQSNVNGAGLDFKGTHISIDFSSETIIYDVQKAPCDLKLVDCE